MKIESSLLTLSASSSQKKTLNTSEQLKVWGDGNKQSSQIQKKDLFEQNSNSFNDFIKDQLQQVKTSTLESTDEVSPIDISQKDQDKINLLTKLIESLTGKKIKFYLPSHSIKKSGQNPSTYKNPKAVALQQAQLPPRQGWGIDYQKTVRTEETSTMSFNAQGVVKTSDGKTINIELSLNVGRQFISENHIAFKAGDALKDPLVVNFGTPSAELTTTKFNFDIDSDGKQDSISFVKSGSGFLVFDRNKDGQINNGSELFGPESGNGFMALRAFDSDSNGWIDENDAIYDQLQIWTKDENGQDQLFALGQKGIGAIYLNAVASTFELKDASNNLNGKIQQTSIFLKEEGGVGTIQHVDLSI